MVTRQTMTGRRRLVTCAAVAVLMTAGSAAWALDPSLVIVTSEITYERPRLEGYRVDWCESWATNCGKPAADRFCATTRGYGSVATKFDLESGIGTTSPTRTQRDRKVCAESFCGGFEFITCSKPAPLALTKPTDNACRYKRQKSFGVGTKKYARGELVGRAEVNRPEDKKESRIDGRLRACFAGVCDNLAGAGIEGRSSGESRVFAGVIGQVYSQKLSAQGGWDKGSGILEHKLGASFPVVPGVKLNAKAGFGAGMELHAAYDIWALPPIADVSGTVKRFANGKGRDQRERARRHRRLGFGGGSPPAPEPRRGGRHRHPDVRVARRRAGRSQGVAARARRPRQGGLRLPLGMPLGRLEAPAAEVGRQQDLPALLSGTRRLP